MQTVLSLPHTHTPPYSYLLGNHTVTLIFMSYCHHNSLSLFCNLEEKDVLFIVLLIFLANKIGIVCQAVNMKKKKKNFRKQLSVCLFGYKRWWGIDIRSCIINLNCKLCIMYSNKYMHTSCIIPNTKQFIQRHSKAGNSSISLCWFLCIVLRFCYIYLTGLRTSLFGGGAVKLPTF